MGKVVTIDENAFKRLIESDIDGEEMDTDWRYFNNFLTTICRQLDMEQDSSMSNLLSDDNLEVVFEVDDESGKIFINTIKSNPYDIDDFNDVMDKLTFIKKAIDGYNSGENHFEHI